METVSDRREGGRALKAFPTIDDKRARELRQHYRETYPAMRAAYWADKEASCRQ